jgi:hypothetical protein
MPSPAFLVDNAQQVRQLVSHRHIRSPRIKFSLPLPILISRFITESVTMQPQYRLRVPVGYPSSIQSDTGAGEGVLLDLWPTGCRMHSDLALNARTYLSLQIAISQERTPLAVEVSIVRWCKDGHFGVEFLRYSQGDRERVTNLAAALRPTEIPAHPAHATSTLSAVGS